VGASLQWRQPPDRENNPHGDIVEFGRGRSRGRGYLAHSDRVGPGILLLDQIGRERAKVLNAEGFTTLVPDAYDARDEGSVLEAAAGFLSSNWHPRLAVMAFGPITGSAVSTLVSSELSVDVLVLHESVWLGDEVPQVPVIGHFSAERDDDALESVFDAIADAGHETELYIYEGTREGFCDPRSSHFSPEHAALADARTLDALEYHLS